MANTESNTERSAIEATQISDDTDIILEELRSLVRDYYEGETEEDWIATLDDFKDFGLAGIDDGDVLKFATADDNKALTIFLKLKGKDADYDAYIDNIKATIDLEKSEADLEKSEADLEYITNLADSLKVLQDSED